MRVVIIVMKITVEIDKMQDLSVLFIPNKKKEARNNKLHSKNNLVSLDKTMHKNNPVRKTSADTGWIFDNILFKLNFLE